ncbi:multiple sugar transport system permease protein [Lentzea atacamensis]|uniref:Multiple sugar transport system permease protein n=1 Tax=Lentzea atacamensis TaxID=531938 RepID=A0ABX9E4B5_9PSEU|nr:carbohydrate ABC transporter permease [Lentzea atacamensis]RAS62233.1 multiple sugar transport system permease protein [Lentzea atacamensis]
MRSRVWLTILLSVVSLLAIGPFALMVVIALTPRYSPVLPHAWPASLTLDNIVGVLSTESFLRWTGNTVIYSAVSVVAVLLSASMAAYVFARKRFPGRDVLLWSLLSTLMVPFHAVLMPSIVIIQLLGWADTYWGLIIPTLANAQAVLLLRQFIRALPDEVFDAARIDGAGDWRVYWNVVLPLCRPVLATLAVFVFLWHWNDFLWPLVVSGTGDTGTLTVGLSTLDAGHLTIPELMSAATVTGLPCLLVFLLLQRRLVSTVGFTGPGR